MTDRSQVEQLVQGVARRASGRRPRAPVPAVYAPDARLRIAGSSDGKPIAIDASRISSIRPWLSILVKTFRLSRYQLLSLTIDGDGRGGPLARRH